MYKSLNQDREVLTVDKIERKAGKFQRLYKKRLRGQPGRRPDKALFILLAAYSIFKQKYPKRKNIASEVSGWLEKNLSQYDSGEKGACFDPKNLYRWKAGRPFKEMQWGITWEDFSVAQKISLKIVNEKEMDQRDIMKMCSISKKELEDLTGLILSQHSGNRKTSKKFIFDR